jgi:hypothetical protein
MRSYQTLVARPRQSFARFAMADGGHGKDTRRREIAGDPLDFRLDKRYISCLFWLVTSSKFLICDSEKSGGKLSDGVHRRQRKIVVKTRVVSHFRLDRGFMKMSCGLAARPLINSQSMLNVRTRKEPHYVIIGTDRPVY